MKQYLWIFLATCLAPIGCMAQSNATAPLGRTTLGFRAGINFQNFNGKDQEGNMLDNNLVTRFNAGVNVEIPVAVDFLLHPGFLLNTKSTSPENVVN
jgi:hypothetical protein